MGRWAEFNKEYMASFLTKHVQALPSNTRAIPNCDEVLTFPSVCANGMCFNINSIHDSVDDKCLCLQIRGAG